jgi:acetolactate synthase I/II/III large subunit
MGDSKNRFNNRTTLRSNPYATVDRLRKPPGFGSIRTSMIKLADYVIEFLVNRGIKDVFTVSGGGILHLLDAVGRHKAMNYYCNYHEQACAVCAEGYARATNGIGACLVTVGPGAVNALAGIVGAWYDSVAMLVMSGQVRRDLMADFTKVRQFGPQEGNVLAMAQPVTKYAKCIIDPKTIRYELECALHHATSGRPGPVWLEFPLDVQSAEIDETRLEGFDLTSTANVPDLKADVRRAVEAVVASRRPLLVCGNGIHSSSSEALLRTLVDCLGVPVVLPYSAKDLLPETDPLYVGVFGTAGQRRANFAVQNCDCILSLASGFSLSKVGFNYKGFAPRALKIMVEIDGGQLHDQVIKPDVAIQCNVADFIQEFLIQIKSVKIRPSPKWLSACRQWKERYPIIVDSFHEDPKYVNSYVFIDTLSDLLRGEDVVVGGAGLDTVSYYQAFKVKPGQRTMTSNNWGSLGWDLPLSIGASVGMRHGRVVCVTGDGSLQWNVQELLTISHYNLPIKIFMFNNRGYASIRATQKALCEGRYVAADNESGVDNPDFVSLATAYGLQHARIENHQDLEAGIQEVLDMQGGVLCEVNISPEQGISPKASAFKRDDGTLESRPLEDMAPFLPREEIFENMHLFDDDP